MNTLPQNFAILTDENPQYPVTAKESLTKYLSGNWPYQEVIGHYNGTTEHSFLVELGKAPGLYAQQRALTRTAKAFGQESILFVETSQKGSYGVLVNTRTNGWEVLNNVLQVQHRPHAENYTYLDNASYLVCY